MHQNGPGQGIQTPAEQNQSNKPLAGIDYGGQTKHSSDQGAQIPAAKNQSTRTLEATDLTTLTTEASDHQDLWTHHARISLPLFFFV